MAAAGTRQHWALEMGGPWAPQPPFLLPPCLHLHSVLFVFCTVKNSVSTCLKPSAIVWNRAGLNKGKSSVSRGRVSWSRVGSWKHQDQTTNSAWDQPEVPQGVRAAALGAAGHLLLLVLPMEHSDFGFWAGSSRLLRLYASVYGAKAKTVNSISKHFNFTLTQEIHLSLKKPVAFTLWTTKGIPCG